jgi:hypothetical protein
VAEFAILLLTFVSSVIGGIAVVVAQSFFTRRLDAEQKTNEARNQSYADYLRGVAEVALRAGSTDGRVATADAKARIAVYGSDGVVHALSEFERSGSALKSEDGRRAFLGVVRAMRSDARAVGDDAVDESLANMLFGLPEQGSGNNQKD